MRVNANSYALFVLRLELLQKAHVILKEIANVANVVAKHGNPFDTHAQREAGVHVGVDAALGEHVGVDHPCPEDFEPTGSFADGASFAMAYFAADIYLSAGFGEGEIAGAETGFYILPEHLLREVVERLLEVSERDVFVDVESLNLMKLAVGAL